MLLVKPLLALLPASASAHCSASAATPLIILAGFVLFLVAFFLVPAAKSPLRKVPGPRLALFTSAALRWNELHGTRTRYVHTLHQKYGPVVRIAPSEVSFSSAAAVKDIYGSAGSGYDKTDFYDLFKVYGRRTMFTTLNKEDHARRRRILADRYANSNVMKAPSLNGIENRSQVFAEICREATNGVLDIYIALHSYAFDCVTHHLFHPYGTDSLRNKGYDAEIMREVTFDDSLQNRLVSYYSPTLHAIVGRILYMFAKPRETPLADNFVLDTSARPDSAPFTLSSRMHEKQQPSKDEEDHATTPKIPGFDSLDVAAESLDHMAAGIDTTGDALCFLMWELSQPRSLHFQKRLQKEVLDASRDGTPFDKLPFLDAVVQEGLRCFPAIPMSLPRIVPGGAWGKRRAVNSDLPNGQTIDGVFLPAGTVVSSQAYSVHRIDESVFPEPDKFNPDRWLAAEGDADRKRLFFAFASGGRGCIGKHLALVEMKLLLRDVYSQFSTAPDASMTPESMEMSDQLISSRPLGQKCLLHFIPLDKKE